MKILIDLILHLNQPVIKDFHPIMLAGGLKGAVQLTKPHGKPLRHNNLIHYIAFGLSTSSLVPNTRCLLLLLDCTKMS